MHGPVGEQSIETRARASDGCRNAGDRQIVAQHRLRAEHTHYERAGKRELREFVLRRRGYKAAVAIEQDQPAAVIKHRPAFIVMADLEGPRAYTPDKDQAALALPEAAYQRIATDMKERRAVTIGASQQLATEIDLDAACRPGYFAG